VNPSERRREKRHEIYHPIRIFIVDPEWVQYGLPARYDGFVSNLSREGMCIYLQEGHNPLDIDDLLGRRIKIEINIPFVSQRFFLLGEVRWGTRAGQARHVVLLGMRFVEMTRFHLQNIEKFLAVDDKDHNMLWDLWDSIGISE
jgi:hypothetical protein